MFRKSCLHSKSKCNKQPRFSWSLIYEKHRGFAPAAGARSPEERYWQYKKGVPLLWDSPRLIIFVL